MRFHKTAIVAQVCRATHGRAEILTHTPSSSVTGTRRYFCGTGHPVMGITAWLSLLLSTMPASLAKLVSSKFSETLFNKEQVETTMAALWHTHTHTHPGTHASIHTEYCALLSLLATTLHCNYPSPCLLPSQGGLQTPCHYWHMTAWSQWGLLRDAHHTCGSKHELHPSYIFTAIMSIKSLEWGQTRWFHR